MTPVLIPTLVVTRDGGALPPGASGLDVYVDTNDGNVVVQVHNGTGDAHVITLETTATVAGIALAAIPVTVAAGATLWVGPFPPALFNDDGGQAHILDASGLLVFTALRF